MPRLWNVLTAFTCRGKGYYNDYRGGVKHTTVCAGCTDCR